MGTRLCLIVTDATSLNGLYHGQLEYLKQAGLELTLICGGSEVELARLREREVGRVINLGLVRPPSPFCDGLSLFRLLGHLLVNRYDIVLSTTPKAILLGSMASWFSCQRRRVVFFQGRVYENWSGFLRWFFAGLDRLAIALSTRALFVSRSLRSAYEADGLVRPGQGEVVGPGSVNGVDINRFCIKNFSNADLAQLKSSLRINPTQLVSVTVGRICRDKGFLELFQLASTLLRYEIVFIIVGQVEFGFEASASELFALPNVRHVPSTTQIPRYFAIADVHLFLTHREGFGNVAVEAASCNVPTIAFDVVGVKDSVADEVSGIRVQLGDLNTVKALLEDALRDRQAFRSRFNTARQWVKTHYAKEAVWLSFLTFFKDIEIEQ